MYTTIAKRISPTRSSDVLVINSIGELGQHDHRLIQGGLRGFDPITLNRRPYETKLTSQQIRTQNFKTSNYNSLNDIETGNIVYYVDGDLAQAYYSPVYAFQTPVEIKLYQDPMGSIKPEYKRIMPYTRANLWGNMFLQDTQYHREDIMALQQRKNNQNKLEALPIFTNDQVNE